MHRYVAIIVVLGSVFTSTLRHSWYRNQIFRARHCPRRFRLKPLLHFRHNALSLHTSQFVGHACEHVWPKYQLLQKVQPVNPEHCLQFGTHAKHVFEERSRKYPSLQTSHFFPPLVRQNLQFGAQALQVASPLKSGPSRSVRAQKSHTVKFLHSQQPFFVEHATHGSFWSPDNA